MRRFTLAIVLVTVGATSLAPIRPTRQSPAPDPIPDARPVRHGCSNAAASARHSRAHGCSECRCPYGPRPRSKSP